MAFSLADVLAVAKIHPFYSSAQYPPNEIALECALEKTSANSPESDLKSHPLLIKKNLYTAIERLVNDTSPENTYRHNVYTSVTGGGSSLSRPLFFATDALENRRQRALFGEFLQNIGVIKRGDWILTTHCGGNLYRSLDLTLEIMENAGGSVLAAGNYSSPAATVNLLQQFNVNVLTGDGSQIVSVVHHISTIKKEERRKIKLDKIIYTSEGLTAVQRAHIFNVLGPVKIFSILGSAEAGPYGASSPDITPSDPDANYADFIIDTRITLIETLPSTYAEGDPTPEVLPEGETGVIAQTSLTRLRNPLVRYVTGDIGSIHPVPEEARSLIPQADFPYFRILRLHGRDRRFSFTWNGDDTRFDVLTALLSDPKLGVLQWQVILDKLEDSAEICLEIRLLCAHLPGDTISEQGLVNCLKNFFQVDVASEHKFKVAFVEENSGFELSKTGRKVTKFIDQST